MDTVLELQTLPEDSETQDIQETGNGGGGGGGGGHGGGSRFSLLICY